MLDQSLPILRGMASGESMRHSIISFVVVGKAQRKRISEIQECISMQEFHVGACGKHFSSGTSTNRGNQKTIRIRGLQPSLHKPKRLTIVRRGRKWFGRILIDDQAIAPPKREPIRKIGLDMGLNAFVAMSDGELVVCPKHYRRMESKLHGVNRGLARCKRGSNRRKRALLRLQTVHAKIADCRDDFIHKLSKRIVDQYDFIAAEKLNIAGLAKGRMGKSILDASWGTFLFRVGYKAEKAGVEFVRVNARGTSQECSGCGAIVRKDLSERVHRCSCGLILDRDVNAARNVLNCAVGNLAPPSGSDGVRHAEAPTHTSLIGAEQVEPLTCASHL